jgi:hypothetical protein
MAKGGCLFIEGICRQRIEAANIFMQNLNDKRCAKICTLFGTCPPPVPKTLNQRAQLWSGEQEKDLGYGSPFLLSEPPKLIITVFCHQQSKILVKIYFFCNNQVTSYYLWSWQVLSYTNFNRKKINPKRVKVAKLHTLMLECFLWVKYFENQNPICMCYS